MKTFIANLFKRNPRSEILTWHTATGHSYHVVNDLTLATSAEQAYFGTRNPQSVDPR